MNPLEYPQRKWTRSEQSWEERWEEIRGKWYPAMSDMAFVVAACEDRMRLNMGYLSEIAELKKRIQLLEHGGRDE